MDTSFQVIKVSTEHRTGPKATTLDPRRFGEGGGVVGGVRYLVRWHWPQTLRVCMDGAEDGGDMPVVKRKRKKS